MSQWQVDKKGVEVLVAKTERPTTPIPAPASMPAPSPVAPPSTDGAQATKNQESK